MCDFLQSCFWYVCILFGLLLSLNVGVHQGDLNIADTNTTDQKRDDVEEFPNDGELFEGDIVMDERLRRILTGVETKKSALTYSGMIDILWPDGVLYYTVDDSFSGLSRWMLREAIYQFEHRTCIRFKKRKRENDYITFSSKVNKCFSNVGMQGAEQIINIGTYCGRGQIEHEIMHALGIIHEHSRPDRDRYVKVNYANINPNDLSNFHRYPYFLTDNLGEKFNFASIMMYPNNAFSKNGRDTLQAINEPELRFGQRRELSVGDILGINRLYKCHQYLVNPVYDGLVRNYHIGDRKKEHHVGIFEKVMEFIQWLLQDVTLTFVF